MDSDSVIDMLLKHVSPDKKYENPAA